MAALGKNKVNLQAIRVLLSLCVMFLIITILSINEQMKNVSPLPTIMPISSDKIIKFQKHPEEFLITFANVPEYWMQRTKTMDFNQCKFSNCKITIDERYISESDAVIFHGPRLPSTAPKRSIGQIWIFLNNEAPHAFRYDDWRYSFNWTMTYRKNSDISFQYGVITHLKKKYYIDFKTILMKKKGTVAWAVSHCNARSRRDEYVRELKKYIDVDIYGKCGNFECRSGYLKCKEELGERYKFYLSFENSICKEYYTEKVYDVYSQKVYMIPVVRGAAGYEFSFPEGTYIFTGNFSSPKMLADYLKTMTDAEYINILKKKLQFHSTPRNYKNTLCAVCGKLNSVDIGHPKNVDIFQVFYNNTCTDLNDYYN